jgi:hypothetical protein
MKSFATARFAATTLTLLANPVEGHGSLVIPQTRNSIDRLAPQWAGGYPTVPDFPGTGRWGLSNESCTPRNSAQL